MTRIVVATVLLSLSLFSRGDLLPVAPGAAPGVAALPADLRSLSNQLRAAMEEREFERAEQLLDALRRQHAAAFTANNFDYLLARLYERRGAAAEAETLFQAVQRRNSILAQYAVWHLARLARARNDLAAERQYLNRLISSYPSSSLVSRARDRLLDNLIASGDHRTALGMLRPQASTQGVRGRRALARLGEAQAKLGDYAAARASFEQLISGSRDDYALRAAQGLDALDRQSSAQPSEFDHLRRARIYLHNRHWSEARPHLMAIVERFPDSPNRAEALYQIGTTYYREDNQDEAVRWYSRAHREFPNKKEGEQGFYFVGTALQKAQRYNEAADRYMAYIANYPKGELVEGAYRNVVDSLRYAGRDADAIAWSRRIAERYAGKPLAVVGLYNEARIEMSRGRFAEAERLLTRLQAAPVHARLFSAPIRGEAAFLKAYVIERQGRLDEAARLYLATSDERDNFFGQRATERLQALANNPQGRRVIEPLRARYVEQARAALSAGRAAEAKDAATQALRLTTDERARGELLHLLRSAYSLLPGYNGVWRYRLIPAARELRETAAASEPATNRSLAAELLFLGLYDEAAVELRLGGLATRSASDEAEAAHREANEARAIRVAAGEAEPSVQANDWSYSMAVYAARGDQGQHALAFGEQVFRNIPRDYRLELLPHDLAQLLYPAPYRDALMRYAPARGVDPRLILAIARQESRFDPAVKSPAAARGLLQFISETAEQMAREEGLQNFELDDVYEPEVAVRLAARYIGNLFKMFPNNPHAVAAGYNTYPSNVERWMFRSRTDDVEAMFAEIAIPETKDYVAKVMSNYRAYCLLYTEELKPRR